MLFIIEGAQFTTVQDLSFDKLISFFHIVPLFTKMSELVGSVATPVAPTSAATNTGTAVVRVGVGCFVTDPVNNPGRILMGTRKGSHGAGKLALPGGHLDMNESWEACAAREAQEETNLTINNLQFFNVTVRIL